MSVRLGVRERVCVRLHIRTNEKPCAQRGLLEVVDDLGLFVQLTDVHQSLRELAPA